MRNQQDAAQAICAMMNTPDGKRLMALLAPTGANSAGSGQCGAAGRRKKGPGHHGAASQ